MDKKQLLNLKSQFDEIVHTTDDGVEYWLARELQPLLGYIEWRKFEGVINRAKDACKPSGYEISEHFVGSAKTIKMPKFVELVN